MLQGQCQYVVKYTSCTLLAPLGDVAVAAVVVVVAAAAAAAPSAMRAAAEASVSSSSSPNLDDVRLLGVGGFGVYHPPLG